MKKRFIVLYIFIFLILLDNVIIASSSAVNIDNYTIINGLSNNKITHIFQDSRGFIWIGTRDGLNQFNGYEMKVFKNHFNDSTSISHNDITSICEDKYGNIWIGTINGLNQFNKRKQSFYRYYNTISESGYLSSNCIEALKSDKFGNLWVKTDISLDKMNINTGQIVNFSFYNDVFNIPDYQYSSSIFIDRNNNIWLATKDGLNYFDKTMEQFKRFQKTSDNKSSLSNNSIMAIIEDKKGNLWIGTENGLNLYNRNTNKFSRYFPDIFNCSESKCMITSLLDYNGDYLFVGTNMGLLLFNTKKYSFSLISDFYKSNLVNALDGKYINNVFRDNSGILWFGTMNHGVYKLNENAKKFNTYSLTSFSNVEIENSTLQAIYLDKYNRLWLGTKLSGISVIDRDKMNVTDFYNSNHFLPGNNVWFIDQINRNEIIIGMDKGIFKKYINTVQAPTDFLNEFPALMDNPINKILKTSDNSLWIATDKGLHRYLNNYLTSYFETNDTFNISSNCVYSLAEDTDNKIWVGTDNGLDCIDLAGNIILHYSRENKDKKYNWLTDNRIYSLLVDTLNTIWVGTADGLIKYNKENNEFVVFSEYDGLANDAVYSIFMDNKKNIWINTNHGISKIDIQSGQISNFDVTDGLAGYNFGYKSAYQSSTGEIFLISNEGITYFNPDSIKYNYTIPDIVITYVDLWEKTGKQRYSVQNTDTVFIPYKSNHFTIEFVALDYTRPERCNYAYKIKGIENNWINIGNNRKTTFSNIPSGTYLFQVKGSNSDNIWNDEGSSIYLVIKAPFWKTKYAYTFYLIILFGSIVYLFQFRTRSLRKSNKMLRDKELAGHEIERQKEELIIKNKSITDSINYAKRIQEAILPSEKYFKKIFPSSFILYMPKDIVSGDFYWIAENDDKLFLAVVDCTGHGVPGAFMSIIGFELLRNITIIKKIDDPAIVLNMLNKGVAEAFNKDAGEVILKDGMDIAFCTFYKNKKMLEFAGAFNPLYLMRDDKIVEVKADRYSVGLVEDTMSYTKHVVPLEGVDMLYLFTDGYSDQFGGPEGKKFKFRRFRHLLLTIHKLSILKQKIFLKESIEKWKGDSEQVDDILIIGINPNEL